MVITNWVKLILDSLYDGILIVDANLIVRYINSSYTKITNVTEEEILGKPLGEVRPGNRLKSVVKTGEKLLGVQRKVGNKEYVVNMVPIIENGQITGGISLLNDISDIVGLTEKLNKSKKIIKDLEAQVKKLSHAKYSFEDIVYKDSKSSENINLARKIAYKDLNVLIIGESGTGKELYAHSIHNASGRKDCPFIPVNCATLDNSLLESELFGYTEGAFTGAMKHGKKGIFQAADGGTVFLDEVTEMDSKVQAKLLRTLQEKTIRPVGGNTEIPVNVRVIAATNQDVFPLIEKGKFRSDLYYRLGVFTIDLNPLRMRKDDIIVLAESFINNLNQLEGQEKILSESVLKTLCEYNWPGNIRELKNTMEYAYLMSESNLIDNENLPKNFLTESLPKTESQSEVKSLSEVVNITEANEIRKALAEYGHSVEGKKKIAQSLGISLSSLYNKLKKLS